MIWHILGILAVVVIYNIWRYYHEDDSYEYSPVVTETSESNQVAETVMEETISTRQLALNTIEHLYSMALQTLTTWRYISRSISCWYRRFLIWRTI